MALRNSSKINEIVCKYIQRVNNKLGIINQFFNFRPNGFRQTSFSAKWLSAKWLFGRISQTRKLCYGGLNECTVK